MNEQLSYLNDKPRQPRTRVPAPVKALHEALAPYMDVCTLRTLAAHGGDVREALTAPDVPPQVEQLLDLLALILRPTVREQIKGPSDLAALLMVEMARFDQEHLRVACLDTKNRVQVMHTVYVGSVDSAAIRVGEVFKEAIRRNSPAIILVHNHPSGDCKPSPEDVRVTRQIIDAGKLLDVSVLDHLVIGHGQYTSFREQGLAFLR